jgi:hypothetical protein
MFAEYDPKLQVILNTRCCPSRICILEPLLPGCYAWLCLFRLLNSFRFVRSVFQEFLCVKRCAQRTVVVGKRSNQAIIFRVLNTSLGRLIVIVS